jgi:hypothetical protein
MMASSVEAGEFRLTIEKCLEETNSDHQAYPHLLFHVDEYKEVRDEIHNEYTLMANRINWLLASQTFLFTALAIATPKVSYVSLDLSKNAFYKIAPVVGSFSCWLISSAIVANILRIWDWKRIQRDLLRKIEYITPKLPEDGLSGFGLLPPIGLPLLFFTLWGYVLFLRLNFFFESRVIIAVFFAFTGVLSVWSSAFFFYCLEEETVNRIFKRPINMIKKNRYWIFFITITVFIALISYSLFSK